MKTIASGEPIVLLGKKRKVKIRIWCLLAFSQILRCRMHRLISDKKCRVGWRSKGQRSIGREIERR